MNVTMLVLTALLVIDLVILASQAGAQRMSHAVQYESNMRLPYKKFKELYPENPIAYRQYKEMQAKQAFKTSIPSKQLKRMVR
ncbi:hypothetical protein E2P71_05230 [Candidatus Bathyarchaeota archaeon]|nr:hypothetical protein E2P71_05230 [Candidatus Bathyarchaeota archaeon]